MDSLYIVMPAYNEEDNISKVVEEWYQVIEDKDERSRLVIADSGSQDNTHYILTELRERFPKIEIISDTMKQHGPKLLALYSYAIQQGADYIFQTDSDGQTDAGDFDTFWENRNDYDAIIGYRPVRGDGKSRALVEKVVCLLLKIYFGINVPDANAPFRLMKTELVSKYMGRFQKDYGLPNIMLTTFFAYYRENIVFREITFRHRLAGENSLNIPKIVKIGWKSLKDFRVFKSTL